MKRVPSWKFLVSVLCLVVLAGAVFWNTGKTDLAIIFFVLAVIEGTFIAAMMGWARRKNHG